MKVKMLLHIRDTGGNLESQQFAETDVDDEYALGKLVAGISVHDLSRFHRVGTSSARLNESPDQSEVHIMQIIY